MDGENGGGGLSAEELDKNLKVKQQRAQGRFSLAEGTRTYFGRDTTRFSGAHSATREDAFETTTGTAADQSVSVNNGVDLLGWIFSTPSGEPSSANWPTGNYRCQLDVTVNGGNDLGLLTLGGSDGHFARVNSGISADIETKTQTEAAFTGTGLKLATTGSVSWSAGDSGDRFECLVAVLNPDAHGSNTTTLELNESDDFADGPWAAGNLSIPVAMHSYRKRRT